MKAPIIERYLKRKSGTQPVAETGVVYTPLPQRATQQDRWSWPWAPAVTQYGARMTNTWLGNQLPGPTSLIPGVPVSAYVWNVPRSVHNNPNWAVQYNTGRNLHGQGAVQSALLQQQIAQAWANAYG